MTTYITIHHLVSLPLGLANRGADGLAKTAIYGGITRQRVSSQCVKAHLREHAAITSAAKALGQEMSVRSALIGERLIAPALVADGATEEEAQEWASALMAALFQGKGREAAAASSRAAAKGRGRKAAAEEGADTEEGADSDEAKGGRQIIVLGRAEVEAITCVGKAARSAGLTPKALGDSIKRPTGEVKAALDTLGALRQHSGLDGSLFGRMATSSVVSSVDGAVSVGHWLSVHRIQSTTDFFSAQDELLTGNEMGTAHIGTAELAGGVFYGSTLIDLSRLRENLGLDDKGVRAAVAAIVEAVLSTDPSAKRGSTGAACETTEAVIEVGEAMGLSAMSAYEHPCAAMSDVAAEVLREHIRSRQARLTARQRPRRIITLSEIIAQGGTIDDLIARAADVALPVAVAAE
jgi:CRISPR system Cascade subunit CasC